MAVLIFSTANKELVETDSKIELSFPTLENVDSIAAVRCFIVGIDSP